MAYNWGAGLYGNTYSRYRRNSGAQSGPHYLRLHNYEGPYDYAALTRARDELCGYVERMQDTAAWQRIQRKTDVNIYDFSDRSDGFGQASTEFSHAGLPENQTEEDFYEDQTDDVPQDVSFNFPENSTKSTVNSTADLSADKRKNDKGSTGSTSHVTDDVSYEPMGSCSLAVDGIEILSNPEHSTEVVVIEDDSFNDGADNAEMNSGILNTEEANDADNTYISVQIETSAETDSITYRCDFCEYVSEIKTDMQEHLNKAVHSAASEYNPDESGRMRLKQPMVLMNSKAIFKTVLVVCPSISCFTVFPNIHNCVEHYNFKHVRNKNERNQYGLINVVKEEACIIAVEPKQCRICSEQFSDISAMKTHFKDMGHYPYTELKGCQKIFFCFYCLSTFRTIESISSHQVYEHYDLMKNGMLQFTVFHYKKVEIHKLLIGKNVSTTNSDNNVLISESGRGTNMTVGGTGTSTLSLGTSKLSYGTDGTIDSISKDCTSITGTNQSDVGISGRASLSTGISKSCNETDTVLSSNKGPNQTLPSVGSSAISNLNTGTRKRKYDSGFQDAEPGIKITVRNEYASSADRIEDNIQAEKKGNSNSDLVVVPETVDGDTTSGEDGLREVFKCDYCWAMTKHRNQMYTHLKDALHHAASKVLVDQQENIVYFKSKKAVSFGVAAYKNVAAACQEEMCRVLFDDIFMCQHHLAHVHSSRDRSYHLVDIMDRVSVKVPLANNTCATCGQSFHKTKQLHNHYVSASHSPFPYRTDCNVYILCIYCQRTFRSFKVASNHVTKHKKLVHGDHFLLMILYVSKTSRKHILPPYQKDPTSEMNSIKSQIASLNRMKKNCGRQGKINLKKQVKELKKLL